MDLLRERVIHDIPLQDVPQFHLVAGNPAKVIRKINTTMDPSQRMTDVHKQSNVIEQDNEFNP